MGKQKKLVTRSDRVNWLRAHPEVLSRNGQREVVAILKAEKLLSEKTYALDVNLFNLLRDAGYSRRACAKFSRMPSFHGGH